MASGTLTIRVLGDTKDAEKKLTGLQKTAGRMGDVGKKMTVGVTLPVAAAGVGLFKLAEEAEAAQAKLSSSFESMGASSFTSMDQLNAHAEALQSATTFDDEGINEFQSVLLTFGNVTGDTFTKATELGLDMSAKLGTDLQSTAVQVGKALNDPVKGVSALSRVGVSFTAQQKEQIKAMVEGGDVAGAQAIIMGELEKQFGGTAEAMAQTNTGQAKQAMNALMNAGESLAMVVAPAIGKVAGWIKTLSERFQKLNPTTKEWIVKIALLVAAIGPALMIGGKMITMGGSMVKAFKMVGKAWMVLSKLFMANPWILLIAAIIALVVLIVKNWDKIKKVIGAAWEWIKRTTSVIWNAITGFLRRVWDNIKRALSAVWESIKRITRTVWDGIVRFFSNIWDKIKRAVSSVGRFFRDAWSNALNFVKNLVLNFTLPGLIAKHWDKIKDGVSAVKQFIIDRWNDVIGFFKALPGRIGRAVSGMWDGIKEAFRAAINWIIDKWNNLSISIGGGSILGVDIPRITVSTPNIPRFHAGTPFFRPPNGAREGLAILERGEAVIPSGANRAGTQTIHVTVRLPNDRVLFDEWIIPGLTRAQRRGAMPA